MTTDTGRDLAMSWNGSDNGDKDKQPRNPWQRNQKPEEGPPDLDQVLKDIQKKIRSLFGGLNNGSKGPGSFNGGSGRAGNGNAGGDAGGNAVVGVALLILVVGYILSGIYIVQPAERAVVTRFGRYVRTEMPGLHWIPRFIESQKNVNVERRETSKHNGAMLTQDENIVSVDIAVQYRIRDAKDYLFNVINPIKSLSEATESALRQVIGQSSLDNVLTSGRASVAASIKAQLIETIEGYGAGLEVFDVTMQPAKAPEEVRAAFDDVIKAREEHESLVYSAQAYANDILPKAQGQVARMTQEAEGYREEMTLLAEGATRRFNQVLPEFQKAPQVTKTRLYLETLEQVFANTNKVIVDIKNQGGGGPMIYLPLDKWMQKPAAANNASSGAIDPTQASTSGASVANNATSMNNYYREEVSRSTTPVRRYGKDRSERG